MGDLDKLFRCYRRYSLTWFIPTKSITKFECYFLQTSSQDCYLFYLPSFIQVRNVASTIWNLNLEYHFLLFFSLIQARNAIFTILNLNLIQLSAIFLFNPSQKCHLYYFSLESNPETPLFAVILFNPCQKCHL